MVVAAAVDDDVAVELDILAKIETEFEFSDTRVDPISNLGEDLEKL